MSFSLQGLASGLQTADIIKGLMGAERVPYTKLETKKSQLESQQAVFRQLNTKLNAMQMAAAEMQYSTAYNKNTSSLSVGGIVSATAGDAAIKGSYDIQVTQIAQNRAVAFEGVSGAVENGQPSSLHGYTFEINGEKIKLDESGLGKFDNNKKALEALAAEINKNSTKYGGRASLIDTDGSGTKYALNITSTDNTKPVTMTVTDGTGVNVAKDPVGATSGVYIKTYGQDAKFLVNGMEITRPTNEIKDVIEGVTLNLTAIGKTTLTVSKDSAAITEGAEKFVNAYNDLMELINTNLAKPDEKNTTNPLQSDAVLKSLKDTLYGLFTKGMPTGVVSGGYEQQEFMEQIGLSIDKNVGSGAKLTGKITFDKAAFTTALSENGDRVAKMFMDRTNNIWLTMSSSFAGASQGIIASKITGYVSQIKTIDERLEIMDRSLQMKEARLTQQFNNMEVMLSSLNNEKDWLTSQFNTLSNSKK